MDNDDRPRLQADLDGAVRVAQLAAEFDWSWKPDDVQRFCQAAGWTVTDIFEGGATLTTDLDLARPAAYPRFRDDLKSILVFVAAVPDGEYDGTTRPASELDTDLVKRLTGLFGKPTRRRRTKRGVESDWELPTLAITITPGDTSIGLHLNSPAYQRWRFPDKNVKHRG
jgi:hypothetical protein